MLHYKFANPVGIHCVYGTLIQHTLRVRYVDPAYKYCDKNVGAERLGKRKKAKKQKDAAGRGTATRHSYETQPEAEGAAQRMMCCSKCHDTPCLQHWCIKYLCIKLKGYVHVGVEGSVHAHRDDHFRIALVCFSTSQIPVCCVGE